MIRKTLIATFLLYIASAPANATIVTNFTSGVTTTSVSGATTFANFDGVANTSIGTITGGLSNASTQPDGGNWIAAFGTVDVTATLTNPVTYFGFDWGTPDGVNTVQVFDGANVIATITGSSAGLTGFHDTNGGFFDIFASGGDVITSVVFSSVDATFELDNFAASVPVRSVPVPGTLPLFAGGFGALGLLRWRRKRKAEIVAG
jgi:hypothetical protein